MGFLSRAPAIEDWLSEAASEWSMLTDASYLDFWRDWRAAFESMLSTGRVTAKDIEAMASIEAEIPFDAVVFGAPGYAYIPAGVRREAPLFAYRGTPLLRIDRSFLNSSDAIVSDFRLRFTCLFTHEVGSLADPIFLDLRSRR